MGIYTEICSFCSLLSFAVSSLFFCAVFFYFRIYVSCWIGFVFCFCSCFCFVLCFGFVPVRPQVRQLTAQQAALEASLAKLQGGARQTHAEYAHSLSARDSELRAMNDRLARQEGAFHDTLPIT